MQAWTDFINGLQENQLLKGIYLSQAETPYIQGHFADDTHLMLAADSMNLHRAKEAIATFGTASGLNVQWSKSLATWISPQPRPEWTNALQWKWTQNQEEHKMLGFLFTEALDQNAIAQKCADKIDKYSRQAAAFAVATITWALSPGTPHPLKLLIRAAFAHKADTVWGTSIEAAPTAYQKYHTGRRISHDGILDGGLE
ncbi:hypothetical protein R1sor_005471 [Riccia sorocarpa]|uniref:Reverse transcriptase domain-containing protein n=1 Tax=Riccia sorocarpa TaxID=122646 RepID=A0ABD3HP32_9MARC